MKHFMAALVLVLLMAAEARAQQPTARFVRAFGGISFLSEPGALVGGTFGVRLSHSFEALVDIGGFTNMLPREIQQDLDDAARAAGAIYGGTLTIDARAPAVYVLGGLRATRTTAQRWTLFVEAGVTSRDTSTPPASALIRGVAALSRPGVSRASPFVMPNHSTPSLSRWAATARPVTRPSAAVKCLTRPVAGSRRSSPWPPPTYEFPYGDSPLQPRQTPRRA